MTHRCPGIGIIGTGWGVRVQLPAFRAAGFDVVALAGRHSEKTHRIAHHHGIPFATATWQDLLTRDDVDLIIIAAPPALHSEMAIAALKAGKHVLCEKPIALDTRQARLMCDAATAHPDQLALIDHELRFLPAYQRGRHMIESGCIGSFQRAEVRAISTLRVSHQTSWSWWSDAGAGGGALGTVGTHQIDILCYLLNDQVRRTRGSLSTFITERSVSDSGQMTADKAQMRPVTADDFADFYLIFGNEGVAAITTSLVASTEEPQSITIAGDQGVLHFVDDRLSYAPRGRKFQDVTPPHTLAFPDGFTGHAYAHYMQATVYFACALRAACQGDRTALAPAATFADGLHTQQVVDAVRHSSAATSDWVIINNGAPFTRRPGNDIRIYSAL